MIIEDMNRTKTMQLATVNGSLPWICTVYFVVHGGNFYWLSFPERRHSQEIEKNPNVAVTIAIKKELPVIGVQSEGAATIVDDIAEIEAAMLLYVEKYGSGKQFVERYKKGKNQHVLYRFTPRKIVLFDEQNFPQNPRREHRTINEIER